MFNNNYTISYGQTLHQIFTNLFLILL